MQPGLARIRQPVNRVSWSHGPQVARRACRPMKDSRRVARPVAVAQQRSAIRIPYRRRSRPEHDRSVIPIVTTVVERAVSVMAIPVGPDGEGDDRYADLRAVRPQQHGLILVYAFDVIAGKPARLPKPMTSHHSQSDVHLMDIDHGASLKLVDQWIIGVWPGPQVDVPCHVAFCCTRQRRQCECHGSRNQSREMFHRACPLWIRRGRRAASNVSVGGDATRIE